MRQIENNEKIEIGILARLVKEYISLLYDELREIEAENLYNVKKILEKEQKKANQIGKVIPLEEEQQEEARKTLG